jgi:hypothetical protein
MKVKTKNKELEIKPLPLGKYAELMRVFEKLPEHLGGLAGVSNDEALKKLPLLLADSLPEMAKILSIGSGLSEDEIYGLELSEATDLFLAVYEVNNYSGIFAKVKKVFTQTKGK